MCDSRLLKKWARGVRWWGTTMPRPAHFPDPHPFLPHHVARYFAAAGIFAPVRSPKGGQFPPLSRAVTQVIPRHISACSPPYPPSIPVFSTGPEVWEVSCITDSSVAFGTYNIIEPW